MNEVRDIFVSVIMITYKHEQFIAKAIEGVLMQKCDFEVELIIADDCSPDKTEEKVFQIIKNHPKNSWIKYTKHKTNKGMISNFNWALNQCKGKYIAMCEGDDYWTDPLKLQKQVDFLEANEEYSACGHTAKILYENTGREELYPDITENKTCTYQHTIEKWIMTTASIVFRNNIEVFDKMEKIYSYRNIISGDQILLATLGHIGDILIMHEAMSVYRKHDGGISNWGDPKEIWKDHIYMFKIFKKIFNSKFNYVLNYRILIKYCNISINELKHKRYFSYLKYTIKGFTFIRTWIDFKTWFGLLILRKDYSKTGKV
ncbi:MAG: putative glycosyltransferase EpsE [Bacteroidetes bacterium ADurb.Bin028]|nr:MAG: putative glycosyltransferase EpsE [Bacteroidetes bacterium ADurb.Bin028]